MRHYDLYGKHIRRAAELELRAVSAMHAGDSKRYTALMNQARDYRASANRSLRRMH